MRVIPLRLAANRLNHIAKCLTTAGLVVEGQCCPIGVARRRTRQRYSLSPYTYALSRSNREYDQDVVVRALCFEAPCQANKRPQILPDTRQNFAIRDGRWPGSESWSGIISGADSAIQQKIPLPFITLSTPHRIRGMSQQRTC